METLPHGEPARLAETWDLTDEQFEAWYTHLAREDRDEFVHIFGGDDYLARFVCALDYLTLQKVKAESPESLFTLAYWIAAKRFEPQIILEDPGTRNRALRAWKSPAVQALFDRVKILRNRAGSIRLMNKLYELGEEMADMAMGELVTMKDKRLAADVLIKIAQLVSAEEQVMRSERTKRGLEQAREALASAGGEGMSKRELLALVKAGASAIGPELAKKIEEALG